ncbi:hypothetical protein E9993_23465, partial [Labilibacter sediminis]
MDKIEWRRFKLGINTLKVFQINLFETLNLHLLPPNSLQLPAIFISFSDHLLNRSSRSKMATGDSLHQSEGTSATTWEVCQSNKAFNFDISSWPEKLKIVVTALEHSSLSTTLSISASVPIALVTEAIESFKEISKEKFSFRLFNRNWYISLNRFCTWLKIP